jgi:hypothetical protein
VAVSTFRIAVYFIVSACVVTAWIVAFVLGPTDRATAWVAIIPGAAMGVRALAILIQRPSYRPTLTMFAFAGIAASEFLAMRELGELTFPGAVTRMFPAVVSRAVGYVVLAIAASLGDFPKVGVKQGVLCIVLWIACALTSALLRQGSFAEWSIFFCYPISLFSFVWRTWASNEYRQADWTLEPSSRRWLHIASSAFALLLVAGEFTLLCAVARVPSAAMLVSSYVLCVSGLVVAAMDVCEFNPHPYSLSRAEYDRRRAGQRAASVRRSK